MDEKREREETTWKRTIKVGNGLQLEDKEGR